MLPPNFCEFVFCDDIILKIGLTFRSFELWRNKVKEDPVVTARILPKVEEILAVRARSLRLVDQFHSLEKKAVWMATTNLPML